MTPEFILWGVTGYITLAIIQAARPTRNRSGWDFVAQTALCALINFLVATGLLGLLRALAPSAAHWLAEKRARILTAPGTGLLVVGVVVALISGVLLSRLFSRHVLRAIGWLADTKRDLEFTDVFFKALNDFLGERIIVSLTSGKVYVGLLLQASGDPNESDRSIVIQPVLSGFRSKEDQRVTFNTDYFIGDELPTIQLLLPMKAVQSISQFDDSIYAAFIQRGVTTVVPAKESGPAESEAA